MCWGESSFIGRGGRGRLGVTSPNTCMLQIGRLTKRNGIEALRSIKGHLVRLCQESFEHILYEGGGLE